MRTAKIADYWRGVYAQRYPVRLDRTQFTNVVGIGTGDILFAGGITAICGNNGVGKTTLLNAIFGSIGDPAIHAGARSRFAEATLSATIGANVADVINVETTFNPSGRIIAPDDATVASITRIDPAQRSQNLIQFFSDAPSIPELLEPYTPRELAGEELETVNYLIGKEYTQCTVTEIADYEELGPFPYVEVTNNGVTYGSEMMGLGELALHVMLWHLGRIAPQSILLMEEPETHISPRSQQALLNVLARESARKKVSVIVTTHSAGIVARIPREHIRLVYRDGTGIHTISGPTENQLNVVIGVATAIRAILLVEDRIARIFGREWITRVAPDLAHQADVRDCGDVARIDAVLQAFPHSPASPRLVGLYDGDQRGTARNWPHTCLPGTVAPEVMLRNAAGDGQRLSTSLGANLQAVQFALQEVTGLNHHDWMIELARQLAVSVEQLVAGLTDVWLSTNAGAAESAQALADLRDAINPPA